MKVRRSNLELKYENTNITKDIECDLTSFSYTDNAHGIADDVSIGLKDEKLKWLTMWFPEKGDRIFPRIKTENWRFDGDSQSFDCGSFIIDEPECSGPPSRMTINGNSMPTNSGFKDEKKTRSWTHQSIKMVASRIATEAGLELYFDSSYNPTFKYKIQEKISDSGFLLSLCEEHDFGMKISSNMLILFSMSEYYKKSSVCKIDRSKTIVKSYSCRTSLSNTGYDGVKIRYRDMNNEVKWYSYVVKSTDKTKLFIIDTIAENYAAAEKMTLLKYRHLSTKEYSISLSLPLNLDIVGAVCIDCIGFGNFDGKYFVGKVTHTIGNGSNTNIEARRVNEFKES